MLEHAPLGARTRTASQINEFLRGQIHGRCADSNSYACHAMSRPAWPDQDPPCQTYCRATPFPAISRPISPSHIWVAVPNRVPRNRITPCLVCRTTPPVQGRSPRCHAVPLLPCVAIPRRAPPHLASCCLARPCPASPGLASPDHVKPAQPRLVPTSRARSRPAVAAIPDLASPRLA